MIVDRVSQMLNIIFTIRKVGWEYLEKLDANIFMHVIVINIWSGDIEGETEGTGGRDQRYP